MKRLAFVLGLCLLPALPGCSSHDEPEAVAPPLPPNLSPSELARGREACQTYADRVCQCATSQPDLATECDLAKARPDALAMTTAGLADKHGPRDVAALRVSARQIIKACIEADARLDPATCPRPAQAP